MNEATKQEIESSEPFWRALMIGIIILIVAGGLTGFALNRVHAFSSASETFMVAMGRGEVGRIDEPMIQQPRSMDRTLAMWAGIGVGVCAIIAAVMALRTRRLAMAILLCACVLLFFVNVLSGVFSIN